MSQYPAPSQTPELSVVIPAYNEEDALPGVLAEFREALDETGLTDWECVVVNDGSRDRTAEVVLGFIAEDPRFRLIDFEANCGQTAAFDAGFRNARGVLLGMMDGDGQNDPRDFPRQINALREQGVDMMCGIRQKRQDSIVRKISSKLANGYRNWATGESVTDVGCSIRVFRSDCMPKIKLFEGMHRFFPTLFKIEGFTIGEIPVNHRSRDKGESKYGINNRLWAGLRDLKAVRWMQRRALRYQIKSDSAR